MIDLKSVSTTKKDLDRKEAEQILKENMDKLHTMADALMKFETIDSDQIDDIMNGREVREPKAWGKDDDSSDSGLGDSAAEDGESASKDGPIGGPAGQH